MKALKYCINGDGNPVCPSSKVLCHKCLDGISDKFAEMIQDMKKKEESLKEAPCEKR
jgi:Mg2+ and Co2+ transporter CorA